MPDKHERSSVWDEYEWERFLQQQDRQTDRYMELLEKHMHDPERDQIIAEEMGWPSFPNNFDFEPDFDFSAALDEEELDEEIAELHAPEDFELHPLYQSCFALTVWLDQILDEQCDALIASSAVKLATNSAIASAKLAAALSDDSREELGMTIAYLKRALKAISNAIEASLVFAEESRLSSHRRRQLHARLFHVRDGIIELMGEYRCEWRRRYGR